MTKSQGTRIIKCANIAISDLGDKCGVYNKLYALQLKNNIYKHIKLPLTAASSKNDLGDSIDTEGLVNNTRYDLVRNNEDDNPSVPGKAIPPGRRRDHGHLQKHAVHSHLQGREQVYKKQNDPEESPQHKVDKQETFVNSPLHEACRKGDLNRVMDILDQRLVDINSRDEQHGRTPLMVAAKEGHCTMFQVLIFKGAKMSEVDNDCKNALHWACKGGHVGMVDCVLLKYRININAWSMQPLLQAAQRGYRDVVEFLVCTGSNVSQGDDVGNNVLHFACRGRQLELVKYLVSQGSVDINSSNKHGNTPLMEAASRGHKDVFEFLVKMGANVSHVDDYGRNILHLASIYGRMEMVKHILSQNLVDINARDKGGTTAAMKAKRRGNLKVYSLLVSQGCPVK
ncbi:ankyrin repeat and KH domain-containing protein mask-like [Haliotis rubra]|uniref:ankyrin repeat and KH domain-containing protein mask-like n=1 Tax=Haliotis rubra TaxID=36100 RepID=UPI001EE5C3ED|nr:ankyrin repeat and KH domain-containing protein mask-like [Haliotis rubra]